MYHVHPSAFLSHASLLHRLLWKSNLWYYKILNNLREELHMQLLLYYILLVSSHGYKRI